MRNISSTKLKTVKPVRAGSVVEDYIPPRISSSDIPIAQSLLTVHTLYDLPRDMQRLDPRVERLEIVIKPVVKYGHQEERITHIPLGQSVIPFSPSDIVFCGGRYVLDLDTLNATDAAEMPKKRMSTYSGVPMWWVPPLTKGEKREETESGKVERAKEENVDQDDKAAEEARLEGIERKDGLITVHNNRLLLQYPCPRGLSVLLDVVVGIQQHRRGSYSSKTNSEKVTVELAPESSGCFSVATEEVFRKKYVTRVVGLDVGGMLCSVAVNPDDQKENILSRLMRDVERYTTVYGPHLFGDMDVAAMLEEGLSEQDIHRRMLLHIDPHYYTRRLENLFALYPSESDAEWRQSGFSRLNHEYAVREEEFMRQMTIVVGPECSAVSSRHRLLAYRKKYSLSDSNIISCLQDVLHGNFNEKLETEPEVVFAELTKIFGKEPRPISYLFPVQTFTPEKRTFFFDILDFATVKQNAERGRDTEAGRSATNIPFTMTPFERPLQKPDSLSQSGKLQGEIDILREKYAVEFTQIIPPIVEAVEKVVEHNQQLLESSFTDSRFIVFYHQRHVPQVSMRDLVYRVAEYTFISPSSLLGSIIFLDRICLHHPTLVINERNVLKLFLASVRVASKVIELRSINNHHFANVFGLDVKSMNLLEEVFIKHLRFDLFLSPDEFQYYAIPLRNPNTSIVHILSFQRGLAVSHSHKNEDSVTTLPRSGRRCSSNSSRSIGTYKRRGKGENHNNSCSTDRVARANVGKEKQIRVSTSAEDGKTRERGATKSTPGVCSDESICNNTGAVKRVVTKEGFVTTDDKGNDTYRVAAGSHSQLNCKPKVVV